MQKGEISIVLNGHFYEPLGSEASVYGGRVDKFHLNISVPTATLDYGHEVAGYPLFDVESVTGTVHLEVKYSEEFEAPSNNFSYGPFLFATTLANTYPVETFEIDNPGRTTAFLLQGVRDGKLFV